MARMPFGRRCSERMQNGLHLKEMQFRPLIFWLSVKYLDAPKIIPNLVHPTATVAPPQELLRVMPPYEECSLSVQGDHV